MVIDRGLNPGPPALEASTLPLGYRGACKLYTCIVIPGSLEDEVMCTQVSVTYLWLLQYV